MPVAAPTAATASASHRGKTMTASLRILGWYQIQASNPVWWAYNRCYPQGQVGQMNFSGRIMLAAELTGPAPADRDIVIQLKSNNPGLLPVPATLTIPRNGVRAESQLTCPSPSAQSQVDITGSYLGQAKIYQVTVKPKPPQPDLQLVAITYQDSAGNAIPRPTNPQAFRGCATFALHHGDNLTAYSSTKLRFAYQHSRGATGQTDYTASLLLPIAGGGGQIPPSGQTFGPRCYSVPGLEVGEYVDIPFTLDPDNVQTESNEGNNRQQVRVTR